MGITIREELCVGPQGCRMCVLVCPADCMKMGENKYPYIYWDECWNCGACELDCHKKALVTDLDWHLI